MGTSVCDYSLTAGANRLRRLIRSLLAVLGLVVAVLRRGVSKKLWKQQHLISFKPPGMLATVK